MFSGIIQTKGRVSQVHQQGLEMTLTITAPSLMTPSLKIGDSIAVNGICLTVTTRQSDAHALRLLISLPSEYRALVVTKGSVAVDGVSLTVVAVMETTFEVDLIPHSQAVMTLSKLQVGTLVNVETDILGKYLARQLALEGSH